MADTVNRYVSGEYLQATGGQWHLEDSSVKAEQAFRMMERHRLKPKTVSEIGCGAGGILAELQRKMDPSTKFVGFDISPQAHQLSLQFQNDHLSFVLGDAFESGQTYDLVLVMDVVEHIEDCF